MTKNQFLLILFINILFIGMALWRYSSQTVRIEVQTQDKIVYKEKIIKTTDTALTYNQLMEKATQMCDNHGYNRVQSFKIDNQGKPVVVCN